MTSCASDAGAADVTDDVTGGGCYSPLKPGYLINAHHQLRQSAGTRCWSPGVDFDASDAEYTAAGATVR